VRLERWEAGTDVGVRHYAQGVELFVVEGEFSDDAGSYTAGCWLRLPMGARHHPRTTHGCTLYVKESGLPYLRAAS
jgi:anti-sigma factor ChrR (cupin superfamily)